VRTFLLLTTDVGSYRSTVLRSRPLRRRSPKLPSAPFSQPDEDASSAPKGSAADGSRARLPPLRADPPPASAALTCGIVVGINPGARPSKEEPLATSRVPGALLLFFTRSHDHTITTQRNREKLRIHSLGTAWAQGLAFFTREIQVPPKSSGHSAPNVLAPFQIGFVWKT
jgi:hypothetical protein